MSQLKIPRSDYVLTFLVTFALLCLYESLSTNHWPSIGHVLIFIGISAVILVGRVGLTRMLNSWLSTPKY